MGNLFQIIEGKTKEQVCDRLKYFSTSKMVLKELGEPIIFEKGQYWYFAVNYDQTVGFVAYKNDRILYAYVVEKYRNIGIFTELYSRLPKNNWEVNSSLMAKPVYEKLGFEVVKKHKICVKMKLSNNG